MTTRPVRFVVSCVALAAAVLASACASTAPRLANSIPVAETLLPFDNLGHDYVRVYLVSPRRQWMLGRVEQGQRTALRIPAEALSPDEGWLRLAVVPGGYASQRVLGDPRAALGATQPIETLLAQKWAYSGGLGGGHLTALLMPDTASVRR